MPAGNYYRESTEIKGEVDNNLKMDKSHKILQRKFLTSFFDICYLYIKDNYPSFGRIYEEVCPLLQFL